MIEMRHPGLEGTATATRDAFRRVWAPRGWQEVSPEESLALQASDGKAFSLDEVNKDDLVTLAARNGVDVDTSARKDKLVGELRKQLSLGSSSSSSPTPQRQSQEQAAKSTEQGGS